MCRSLKEVERFEKQGARPYRKAKEMKAKNTEKIVQVSLQIFINVRAQFSSLLFTTIFQGSHC